MIGEVDRGREERIENLPTSIGSGAMTSSLRNLSRSPILLAEVGTETAPAWRGDCALSADSQKALTSLADGDAVATVNW